MPNDLVFSSSIMYLQWVHVVVQNFGAVVDGQAWPCMGGGGVMWWWSNKFGIQMFPVFRSPLY